MKHVKIAGEPGTVRLIVFALIVGLVAGLVGSVFRMVITRMDQLRVYFFTGALQTDILSWMWPILFSIGGVTVATYLVRKFAPEASGSGVHEIEGALDGIRPMRWQRVLPIKFIASIFSLGSGLLLGREGPTIQIGANIGKMIRDVFKQSEDHDNALVSAGAAAGLASAFNAPFAGIIFVIEEMNEHFIFNFYSLSAVILGSGTADFIVRVLVGSEPVIQMTLIPGMRLSEIWLFIVLGLIFGLVGYLYNKLLILSMNLFRKAAKYPTVVVSFFVGMLIALIGIFFPDLIGSGYETIGKALNGYFSLTFLLVLFILRLLLSVFSYGNGSPGGIFAPMLTLGVVSGMLFGGITQILFPGQIAHPTIFAVAGMAGIFASTVRAPLTGLVLAVEMTSNFGLILPLMITTVTASVLTSMLGNQPIYSTLLHRILAEQHKE